MKTTLVLFLIAALTIANAQESTSIGMNSSVGAGSSSSTGVAGEGEQKQGRVVVGTVIDQSSREPVAKAKVALLGTKFSTTTGGDGQYKIESIPDGIYQVRAEAAGYDAQVINNLVLDERMAQRPIFFTLQKSQQEPPDFLSVDSQPTTKEGYIFNPVYPESARKDGVEGVVWVKLLVDSTGVPKKAMVTKSDAEVFNQASIDAAMKWRFGPAILKGAPVAVWITIPFKFKLNHKPGVEKLEGKK